MTASLVPSSAPEAVSVPTVAALSPAVFSSEPPHPAISPATIVIVKNMLNTFFFIFFSPFLSDVGLTPLSRLPSFFT